MDGRVFEFITPPDDFAIEIETSGPLMSEVNEKSFAFEKWRGTGMTVLCVDGSRAGVREHFALPDDLACGRIEAERLERWISLLLSRDRGCEINPAPRDDGGRPTAARDGLFPCDVRRAILPL